MRSRSGRQPPHPASRRRCRPTSPPVPPASPHPASRALAPTSPPAAGEAYFAKVLTQTKGKDLLAGARLAGAAPGTSGGGGSSRGGLPRTTFDEDFLQAGAVIEGARTYVLGTLFVAAQAVQLVFFKVGAGCSALGQAAPARQQYPGVPAALG